MGDRQQPMRAIAAGVMLAVENGQSLSQCLPPALNRLPANERPELQALCYGTCRWFHRLEPSRYRPSPATPLEPPKKSKESTNCCSSM